MFDELGTQYDLISEEIENDCYAQTGRGKLAVSVLESLCDISRERNDKKSHQELLLRVLKKLGDHAPDAVVRIASLNIKYFDGLRDEISGEFFWLYACALQQLGKFAEAVVFYEKCYKIRHDVYGESNWFTAVAKRDYVILSHSISGKKYGESFLFEFIDNIENGVYLNVDVDILKIMEGKTLYTVLMDQSDIGDLNLYESYLSIFEDICDTYNLTGESLLKIRLARNLRGGFYLKTGDYIRAEAAFLEALGAEFPHGVLEIITEAQIKSNLLLIYYMQNDMEMALPILEDLLDALAFDEKISGLTEKDAYRIYTLMVGLDMRSMIELGEGGKQSLKDIASDLCNDILQPEPDVQGCAREIAMFVICSVLKIINDESACKEELQLYLDAACKISREVSLFSIDRGQRALLNYVSAFLAWNLSDDAKAENYFKNSLEFLENAAVPESLEVAILQSIAIFFARHGEYNTGVSCLDQAFEKLEGIWQSYVKYLNDERLIQILAPTQLLFSGCYHMLRQFSDIEQAYERVLQFKALASLAGKERNRILRTDNMDSKLLNQIRIVQDRLSVLEAENAFRDVSKDYEEEAKKLRRLENEFSKKFSKNNNFTYITWNHVQRAVPDNSVVVEYVYCAWTYGQMQFEEDSDATDMGFDVYITKKKGGCCSLVRLEVPDGETILEKSEEFVQILQAKSKHSASARQISSLEEMRILLYKSLVKPILPHIDGFDILYIAPDYDLNNLPFEILYDEEQERLIDKFNVIKLECARDFLYKNQRIHSPKGSLIIGNPQYELNDSEFGEKIADDSDQHRSFKLDFYNLKQLPFSQVEAQQTGRHCGSDYYTGSFASKQLLLSAEGYRNIHIATHGYFDLSDGGTSGMYSSCLLFAGVCNWHNSGKLSEKFGNGIITADEISRMDFGSVELVVLSSCLSGMNDIMLNKGFHGMVGAMSAAGVHYVISHLWEADDFGTAILMDEFYYQYAEKKKSPPVALSLAKRYLRQVTIGELKDRHWFELLRQGNMDLKAKQVIAQYENMDDRMKPFKGEEYWGGFVCYQCNWASHAEEEM